MSAQTKMISLTGVSEYYPDTLTGKVSGDRLKKPTKRTVSAVQRPCHGVSIHYHDTDTGGVCHLPPSLRSGGYHPSPDTSGWGRVSGGVVPKRLSPNPLNMSINKANLGETFGWEASGERSNTTGTVDERVLDALKGKATLQEALLDAVRGVSSESG